MRILVNIQTKSKRADKKVWDNNGLSGSNSDVVIVNERIALILLHLSVEMFKKIFFLKEEEEDIFQTRDSKAISKVVSKEESSL